jgi:hypothetical protein
VEDMNFDRLSRAISEQTNRRGMLKVAAAGTLAALGLGAVGRAALGQDVTAEARGYRRDDCSRNANICRQGLECDPDTLTCEYKDTKSRRCGGKLRGKKNDDCEQNSDCCKRKNLTCNKNNNKCKRKKNNNNN